MMDTNEKEAYKNPEREFDGNRLQELGQEQAERLNDSRAEKAEAQPENTLETARADVERVTQERENEKQPNEENETVERDHRKPYDTKSAYSKTMEEIEQHFPAVQRSFSRFIHNPVVEKTSEIAGATVARPNAILFGSLFAFLFTLAIYIIASKYGYPLSGAETIASFAAGWLVGQLFDYFRIMITGKR